MNNEINCPVCFEMCKNYIITDCTHSICLSCFSIIFLNDRSYKCVICRQEVLKKIFVNNIKPLKYEIEHDFEDFHVNILTNSVIFKKVKLYFHVRIKHKDYFFSNLRRTELIYKRLQEEIEIYVNKIINNWKYEIKNININDNESNDSYESDEDNNLKIIFNETQKSNSNEIFIYSTNDNYNNFTVIVY